MRRTVPSLRPAILGAAALAAFVVLSSGHALAAANARDPAVCSQVARALKAHTPSTEPLEIKSGKSVYRFNVEIAADDDSRELGLMCRHSMAPSHGMLFEFDRTEAQTFWMKNTYLPLDIIYIGADGRIVSIARGAPFDETPLPSGGPAKAVLELKGGLSRKLGIHRGDRVTHAFFRGR